MYDRIGELIARRRKELGMNQAQLAASMNKMGFSLSNQAVSKWENGSTLPNAKQFLALCDALGIFLVLAGLAVLRGLSMAAMKLVLILLFLWITSPVASHLLAEMEIETNPEGHRAWEEEER